VDDEWEISDGKTTTLRFNNSKRLRLITVAKGSTPQTTTITYNSDGKIASVVDGMGTTYDFDRTVNGQVTIKRGTTALVTVTYDAGGKPTKITNCLDSSDYTEFTYSGKRLTTVKDNASRNKAVISYNSIGNVLSACNYVVANGNSNATESYFLSYKYLHTYVKFCDIICKSYGLSRATRQSICTKCVIVCGFVSEQSQQPRGQYGQKNHSIGNHGRLRLVQASKR